MDVTDPPAFHFNLDLLNALVEAIPALTRARQEVVLFFQACGVAPSRLNTVSQRLADDRSYNKYNATREVLTELNTRGDGGLRERREVIKRVIEWEDFSLCYPNNQLKAKGAVAAVSQLVEKRDAFTRMKRAHDAEQRQRREDHQRQIDEQQRERQAIEAVRDDLYALFPDANAHRRGKALEGILNRLFETAGILVREAFEVRSLTARKSWSRSTAPSNLMVACTWSR